MAKIPLRAYVKEIENLIERGEIEQAVAHAKNVLKSYPKHIDTYRLLGKAFLESQRYSEAADILQRVLSVVPDDFVSQIGMSIIREDEGNLDAAIWHMERAYEVQPFNPAVHDELRRLYGRRDGIEPPKIRLTRGALVRMYNRGELYPQAIAEIRAALAEDPQRLDLRVLLARLYYLCGQKNDAAEVCSELISKLPYCYEANRLLSEILPGTNRAEEAKKFQQRIYALDPYEAFTTPAATSADQVPDQAVQVERFMWDSAMEESAAQTPEWTRTIGVQWEETEAEALPDWLNTLKPEDQGRQGLAATAAPAMEEKPAEVQNSAQNEQADQEELVPDWMKEAGWTFTNRSADEIVKEQMQMEEQQEGEPGSDEVVPGEIPDWLQSMAPPQASQTSPEEEERTGWLEDILPSAGGTNGAQAAGPVDLPGFEAESPAFDADLPDWLSAMDTTSPEVATSQEAAGTPAGEAELPDWIAGIAGDEAESPTQEAGLPTGFEGLPDWSQPSQPSDQEAASADNLDWLKDFEPGASETDKPADQASSELDSTLFGTSPSEPAESSVEGVPDWLSDMRSDELPDLSGFETPGEAILPEGETQSETIDELPAADLPDWLAGLAASDEKESVTPQSTLETAEELPSAVTEQAFPSAEISQPESEVPTAQKTEEPAPNFDDMYAAMAWLESLAAKQGADEATLITPPDQRTEVMPDWLAKETEQPVNETPLPGAESPVDQAVTEQPASSLESLDLEAASFENVEANTSTTEPSQNEQADDLRSWLASLPIEAEQTAQTPAEEPSGALIFGETGVESAEPEGLAQQTAAAEPESPMEVEVPLAENQPAAEPGTMPDFSDMDAAMAWLESLAAKQGADEATLVTPPEQRTETPPDWVMKEMETTAAEPPAESAVTSEETLAPLPDWMQFDETSSADFITSVDVTASAEVSTSAEVPVETVSNDSGAQVEPTQPIHIQKADETALAESTTGSEETASIEEPTSGVQLAETEAAVPDFSDMDAAMAWLESLAAKQGADEATLVTPPEQRTDIMPDWVAKEAAQEEQSVLETTQPLMEEQAPEAEAAVPEVEQPETELTPAELPDWMREIADRQAEQTSLSEEILPAEELPSAEMQPSAEIQPMAEEPVSPVSFETPVETQSLQAAAEAQPEASAETDFDAAFAWLESLAEKQGAQEGTLITTPEERQETPPEWVSGAAETLPEAEAQPATEELPKPEEPLVTETLPMDELPTIDNLMAEQLPADFAPMEETQPLAPQAEDLPDWLKQVESEGTAMETTTQPESIDDWLKGLENEPEPPELEGSLAPLPGDFRLAWEPEVEIQHPTAETLEPAPTPIWPAGDRPNLTSLEEALNHGNLDQALSGYNQLINEGQHLDEAIHDLRDALYRYPVDINLWQTLGDAYARNNQLQEALDAYTKAEELLR